MTTRLDPYLGFRDNARDAMEFYHSVFGGEVTFSTFGDLGGATDPSEPLVTAPWGDTFGMCTDRFGTRWLLNIGGAGEG